MVGRCCRIARSAIALLIGALAVACALAPAVSAQAWSSPLTISYPGSGQPSALAVDRDGNAIVVWGMDVQQYRSPGNLTIDTVEAGTGLSTRAQSGDALILDIARSAAGDVDVLVQEGSVSPVRLVLLHAGRDGSVRRVWSTRTQISAGGYGMKAAVARRGSRVAVAWLAARSSRNFAPVRLRLATGRGGSLHIHNVDGVLPSWVDNHLGHVHSSDLAIDASGRPVIAFTARRRLSRRTLVLATLGTDGRVRTRQLSPGVEGLVTMRDTPGGRIGVLVEDTGIEGDFGECVNDLTPRRLVAVLRGRRSSRFGTLQHVATPPFSCNGTEGQLVAGPDDRLSIVWGTAPDMPPELAAVHVATAQAGQRFTAPATIATGLLLRSAAYDADALTIATVRPLGEVVTTAGPLFVQRFGLGAPGPLQPIDGAFVRTVLGDADPSGRVGLAWQRGSSQDLLLSTRAGSPCSGGCQRSYGIAPMPVAHASSVPPSTVRSLDRPHGGRARPGCGAGRRRGPVLAATRGAVGTFGERMDRQASQGRGVHAAGRCERGLAGGPHGGGSCRAKGRSAGPAPGPRWRLQLSDRDVGRRASRLCGRLGRLDDAGQPRRRRARGHVERRR